MQIPKFPNAKRYMLKWYIFINMNQELVWETSELQNCSKNSIKNLERPSKSFIFSKVSLQLY